MGFKTERTIYNKMGLDDRKFSDLCNVVHEVLLSYCIGDNYPSNLEVLLAIGTLSDKAIEEADYYNPFESNARKMIEEEIGLLDDYTKAMGDIYSTPPPNQSDWEKRRDLSIKRRSLQQKLGVNDDELKFLYTTIKRIGAKDREDMENYDLIYELPFHIVMVAKKPNREEYIDMIHEMILVHLCG